MKKAMSLKDKIRVVIYWLTKHKNGVFECCHYCNSTEIQRLEGADDGDIYRSKHKCLNCGAVANITEVWNKPSHKTNKV